jgi:hypothetical protein
MLPYWLRCGEYSADAHEAEPAVLPHAAHVPWDPPHSELGQWLFGPVQLKLFSDFFYLSFLFVAKNQKSVAETHSNE